MRKRNLEKNRKEKSIRKKKALENWKIFRLTHYFILMVLKGFSIPLKRFIFYRFYTKPSIIPLLSVLLTLLLYSGRIG